jgi:hypothetical protein
VNDPDYNRLRLEFAARDFAISTARDIIDGLLRQLDMPERREMEELARDWLRTHPPSKNETMNALGAILRGEA